MCVLELVAEAWKCLVQNGDVLRACVTVVQNGDVLRACVTVAVQCSEREKWQSATYQALSLLELHRPERIWCKVAAYVRDGAVCDERKMHGLVAALW